MKNFFLIFFNILLISCKSDSKKNVSDWINLFDGTSLEGWRAYNGNEMPPGWMVIDSILTFTTDQIMEKIMIIRGVEILYTELLSLITLNFM